ncbi:alanine dehydrogenase [Leptolyngbya sp. 7M]|uniref:alanine dehydrogenase n=1 Tax=Leptolyngbya sp. 7M TaxID=2812896 RepID=UPI001B8D8210|nr:hypothetical protein [Leptolyngbya sp. 7M]QYO67097.1 hypothetical protein JVX88_09965 [Leptolyngbya sp. 7M]
MKIGLPKEIKDNEYRVGLTPAGVHALVGAGHQVFVQKTAGEGSGFSDDQYKGAGATLVETADDAWGEGDMVVKVKEPIAPEYPRMRENQLLFTYLHLAPEFELTKQMMERNVTGVAYETITDMHGKLPLLTPMSEVAGRMSVQVGATYLEKMNGGRGILLSSIVRQSCSLCRCRLPATVRPDLIDQSRPLSLLSSEEIKIKPGLFSGLFEQQIEC